MALINDFLSLIYPRHCEACSANLFGHELFVCNLCRLNLPKSNYHTQRETELSNIFAGRVPLVSAGSYYLYEKSGRVQKLLQAIKYEGQKELGEHIGILYGEELRKDNAFESVDLIAPIPLHKNKLKIRGYNQSEWFARGLAKSLSKSVNTTLLERITDTSTQTKKKKYQRWENVEGIFKCDPRQSASNKHILLVDDVITTGATIEAAWLALKEIEAVRVSVASIAFASKS
jgi:ComF family protein